ncbi:hypothetical protein DITRI_Ditri05aG0108400 [Diplodiscus trichospermus]
MAMLPDSKMQKDSALIALILNLLIVPNFFAVSQGQLRVGFYSKTCPSAESIIRGVVRKAMANNPRNAAILLRLQFHDCFVEGYDASILIKNDKDGELKELGNLGVLGFDIIDNAKAKLENLCPKIVSCADIMALAARDVVSMVKGPFYDVPTGRREGRLSKMSLARTLLDVDDSIDVLKSKFREKGAHTIGVTAYFFMRNRLCNFTRMGGSDPAINPRFLPQLKAKCPLNGDFNVRIPLDWATQNVFDVQILRDIRDGIAVIASDARLYDDKNIGQIINYYISSNGSETRPSFNTDFTKAMVKMGNIGVKTDSQGEIRRVCNAVKGPFYDVPTGRREGRFSKMSLARTLLDVDDSIDVLKSKFREKVIASDARLYDDKNIGQIIDYYISSNGSETRPSFNADFTKAMVKMGNIGVKTDSQGEIRRVCNAVN